MKQKFKSYGFWTALAGAVVVFVEALGKCFGFAVESELVSGVIMAIAGVLVVLGVVTMPKEPGADKASDPTEEPDKDEEKKDNK